ncbi:MAG: site-specific integrase [Acidimicrobiales bacterium]
MPPVLWDVLAATPPPPDLSGLRDRALLLVGFVGALRRSELAAVEAAHLGEHPRGVVLTIPRSKTDLYAEGQLVALPYSSRPERCPATALQGWLDAAGIADGPVFRPVPRGGKRALPRGIDEGAINRAVQRACIRAALGLDGRRFSAHSLRAGLAPYASQRGASDRAIAHQTRHRLLGSLDQNIRHETAWTDNAATALDL